MTLLLIVLSVVSLLGRLALVALAGRELLTAMSSAGRLRRRHAIYTAALLVGALIRL